MENMQRRETIASTLDIKVLRLTDNRMRVKSSMTLNFKDESMIYLLAPKLKNTNYFKVVMAYTQEEYSKDTFEDEVLALVKEITSGLYKSGSNLLYNGDLILSENTVVFDELETTTQYRYFITLSQNTDSIFLTEVDTKDGKWIDYILVDIGDISGIHTCSRSNVDDVARIVRNFIDGAKDLILKVKEDIEELRTKEGSIGKSEVNIIEGKIFDRLMEWYKVSDMTCLFTKDDYPTYELFALLFRIWKKLDPEIYEYTYGPKLANDNYVIVSVDDDSDWEDVYDHKDYVIVLPYTEILTKQVIDHGEASMKDIYGYLESLMSAYTGNLGGNGKDEDENEEYDFNY